MRSTESEPAALLIWSGHRNRFALALAAAMVAAVALVGCGSDDTPQEAAGDYCEALDELGEELEELGDLVAQDATLDELGAQRDAVREAADRVDAAAGAVDESISEAIHSARGAFAAEVDDIPGDASVSEALAAYRAALENFVNVVGDAFGELSC